MTTVIWKAVARIARAVMQPSDLKTKAFRAAPSVGIFKQFGTPMSYSYVPLHLDPTPTYYQRLRRDLLKTDHELPAGKFPYKIPVPEIGDGTLGLNFRLYPPYYVIVSVRLELADIDFDSDRIFSLRYLHSIKPIATIIRSSLGLINSPDHRNPEPVSEVSFYPAIHLHQTASQLLNRNRTWNKSAERLVGLLINRNDYDDLSPDIFRRIETNNSEFNMKSSKELLLVNKQGIVLLTEAPGNKFARAVDMIEIALVMRRFLNDYPAMRTGVEDFADFVYWRIRSWTRMPEALFTASVSNSYLWLEIVRELRLERLIEKVEVDSPWVAQQLHDSVKFFDSIADSWWNQPGFAATFLYAPHPGRRLQFVTDKSLRESLLIDIQEAERALASRSYKSAIVMSGAAAEAILLAVLIERTKLSKPKLLNQGLSDYVQHVESEPNVRVEKGALNIVNETLRLWRNVVHPGRVEREAVLIDANKATLAVHALRTLIAELDK